MREARPSVRGRSFIVMMGLLLTKRSRIRGEIFWTAVRELRERYGRKIPSRWPRSRSYLTFGSTTAETLEENPHALEWILSDTFCLSPEKWPESMLGAFKHRLIPSPYEYGRIWLRAHVPYKAGDQHYLDYGYLKLYAYGMPLRLIAAHFDVEERAIHEGMFRAMAKMYDFPAFVVWATATDFRKAKMLPQMWHVCGDSPGERGKFLKTLQTDIFSLDVETLRPWVNSPLILSYLIYSTPKQPREGVYPCDNYLGSTYK
jgi:hypothetical protein